MNHISRKFSIGLIILAVVLAFAGCTDKPTGPVNGPNVTFDISYDDAPSPKLLQQVQSVRLTIAGLAMDTMVVTTNVTDSGTFYLQVDSVPSGPGRVFILELFGYSVGRAQIAPVIYRGITVANVAPDAAVTVPIKLVPTVPMLKLTPKFRHVASGSTFYMNLMAYNMPTAVSADIIFYWGYFQYFGALEPQPTTRPGNIPPGIFYSTELWNDDTQYRVAIGDNETFIPFTGVGPTLLASIPFTTTAFTGDTVVPAPMMYFSQANFQFLDSTILELYPEIYLEQSQVIIDPLPDRPLFFPDTALTRMLKIMLYDTELADTIWLSDALGLYSFNGQRSNIQSITGLDQVMNLENLYLGYTGVKDIRPVAGLKHLQQISIDSSGIPDITPIADLKDLWYVSFNDNQISNLAPLGNLPNLQSVYLRNNNITDITPLITNTGLLGQGDTVDLTGNTDIPQSQLVALRAKNVVVIGP